MPKSESKRTGSETAAQANDRAGIDGDETPKYWPRLEHRIRGAYIVTPASLRKFEELLSTFVRKTHEDELREEVHAIFRGRPSQSFDTVDPIRSLRNPRRQSISMIQILVHGKAGQAAISLDEDGVHHYSAAVLVATAPSAHELSKLDGQVEEELRNIRYWYSPLCAALDSIRSGIAPIRKLLLVVLVVLLVLYFGFATFSTVKRQQARSGWQEQARSALEQFEADDDKVDAKAEGLARMLEQSEQAHSEVLQLLLLLALCFGGWLTGYLTIYLFPRMVFEIGEGVERHQHLRRSRRFVIGSCGILGLAIPALRYALFK